MADKYADGGHLASEADALEHLTEVELWLKKIADQKNTEDAWRKKAEDAEKLYESGKPDEEGCVEDPFNVLHANVETIIPALYNSTPIPDVRRRYGDGGVVEKMVVDISERMLSYSVDQYPYDEHMKAVVKDGEVVGRGVKRVRYKPYLRKEGGVEVKGYEETSCEHVQWRRFIPGPGPSWEQLPWIAFELDLDKDEFEALAQGQVNAEDLATGGPTERDHKTATPEPQKGVFKSGKAYEIWDKRKGEVLFISDQLTSQPVRREPDPLKLSGFFPVPRPYQPIQRLASMVPVVPYNVYEKLAAEMNKISRRIVALTDQLRVRGLADKDLKAAIEKIALLNDGEYEYAENASQFASSGGGLEKAIAHWPTDPTVKALAQLYINRAETKALLDQISGVNDIQRGDVDPREKLGQSQMKAQWGSLRIQDRQNAIATMAREVFRIKVEIYAGKFSEENIRLMTGLPSTEEQQKIWQPAIQMFRSQIRSYKIDIETNSTVRGDTARNQEQMNMFLAGTAQFVQGMVNAAQLAPMMLPTMVEVYTAFARNFKLGKQAEDALDKLSQMAPQLAQTAMQASQQNPEAEKAKREAEAQQREAQMKAQEREQEMAMAREKHELEKQKMQLELEFKQQSAQMDQQNRQQELAFKQQAAEQDIRLRAKSADQDMSMKRQSARFDLKNKRDGASIDIAKARGEPPPMPVDEPAEPLEMQNEERVAVDQERATIEHLVAMQMQGMQQLAAGFEQLALALATPKQIKIARGRDGKMAGAISMPANGAAG